MRLIPFERYFRPEERDPRLEATLQAEAPGILNWLIQGCLLWQQEGLQPPAKVRAAVEEYRRDEDLLGDFIEECTERRHGAYTSHAALFRRYADWARHSGIRKALTKKGLAKALREKNWEEFRSNTSRLNWRHIALEDSEE